MSDKWPVFPHRIGNWLLGEALGAGFSGSIFRATNIYTNQVVALKIQPIDSDCPTNRYERHIYPALQGGVGMPTLWASGVEGPWDYLVIDFLGASLDSLFRKSGKQMMDLRSVCSIAIQVISRLEFMHSRGVLHRDIQLGNCVIGQPPFEKVIYMIDFGFSKRYIDPHTKRHIPDSNAKRDFIGNYWFSSVAVHCRGKVPSRRDDLEAAALMFIHMLTPCGLPWTRNGVPKTDAAHEKLKRAKKAARPEDLCRGMPAEFEEFLRYCRRLQFAECPDYGRWIDEFKALAVENGFPNSAEFVWPPPEPRVQQLRPAVLPQRLLTPQPLPASPRPRQNQDGENMEKVLNDLANLRLDARPVLGDRKNVQDAVRQAKDDAAKDDAAKDETAKKTPPPADEVIVISSSDASDRRPPAFDRLPKARQLLELTADVLKAAENRELARLVADFVGVLKAHTSRTLTKEGFSFLDALHKQLADPSVFLVPLRTSRNRNGRNSANGNQQGGDGEEEAPEPRHVKMNKLGALKRDVGVARNNREVAKMVVEFGAITNRSSGRTLTKDGLAFLEGVAMRLKDLQ
ncbi:hypothetical protein JAAARDRAFT_149241 [Jaapia argillacea MUCL 33604]|uniref:Protein kinase domain-containing protein n=1 Tax=Jaapia argillacea MUCL 33604 TaxID=933084 RepID=A0A067Q8B4_9AGAM|nr:hypothetical protein JAAARDRAFT_149241 [Jaapia argillacea MUCL 33604]